MGTLSSAGSFHGFYISKCEMVKQNDYVISRRNFALNFLGSATPWRRNLPARKVNKKIILATEIG